MVKHGSKRPDDPAAMGAGDSQLDLSPPNVEEAQPPAQHSAAPASAEGGEDLGGAAATAGTAAPEATAAGPAPASDLELEGLRRDLKDATDRHLRLAAEFDNYRKRVERERAETWGRAQADLVKRLLDALDDLERVAHHSESATPQTLLDGVQMIERKLRTALTAAGLEEVAAENASFDPGLMEAVAIMAADSSEDDDVVSDVFQRGYVFKGQLLRAARVRVKKHD